MTVAMTVALSAERKDSLRETAMVVSTDAKLEVCMVAYLDM